MDYKTKVREIVSKDIKICETEEDIQKLTDHITRYANATLPNTLNNELLVTLTAHLMNALLLKDESLDKIKMGLVTVKYLTSNGLINPHYYISHPTPDNCSVSEDYYKSVMPKEFCTCKNILLKDSNNHIFLVIVPFEKRINIKELRRSLKEIINDCGKLQFVTEEEMKELLKVENGSLSLFSLIFDKGDKVTTVLDDDLPKERLLAFHPNYNKVSLFIFHSNDKSMDEVGFFLRSMGKRSISLKVPEVLFMNEESISSERKL